MIKIGCDPELFIKEDDRVISFHGKINGKVKEPVKFGYGQVLEDGCALEFNLPPALSCEEFDRGIEEMLRDIKSKWDYTTKSYHEFSNEEIDSPLCWESGCSSSINAINGLKIPSVRYYDGFRACGGHVHLGWDNPNKAARQRVGIMCDYYLGLPSILMDKEGLARRKVYGKAGDIRYKPYGIEYRSLSNFWIFESKHREWVYSQAVKAVNTGLDEDAFMILVEMVDPRTVQEAINTGEGAEDLLYYLKEVA